MPATTPVHHIGHHHGGAAERVISSVVKGVRLFWEGDARKLVRKRTQYDLITGDLPPWPGLNAGYPARLLTVFLAVFRPGNFEETFRTKPLLWLSTSCAYIGLQATAW